MREPVVEKINGWDFKISFFQSEQALFLTAKLAPLFAVLTNLSLETNESEARQKLIKECFTCYSPEDLISLINSFFKVVEVKKENAQTEWLKLQDVKEMVFHDAFMMQLEVFIIVFFVNFASEARRFFLSAQNIIPKMIEKTLLNTADSLTTSSNQTTKQPKFN